MIKFPSIGQFRNVVQNVKHKASYVGKDEAGNPVFQDPGAYPKLKFTGLVKLHGTNAAVVYGPYAELSFQSRERVLSYEQDNAGFCTHMSSRREEVMELVDRVWDAIAPHVETEGHSLAIYGEWCGGNIQRNVALTQLPKMFVVFAAKIGEQWLDISAVNLRGIDPSIHSIYEFPTYSLWIDFNQPEVAQAALTSITQDVEAECPVGRALGVSGIGEGVVWFRSDDLDPEYWFKVKGEKHSASKVKTLASPDLEALANINEFIEATVTEARLEQGLQNLLNEQLKPFDMTSIGDFIRWVHADVVKEESDTLIANGIEHKKIGGPIARKAKAWYVTKMEEAVTA
ncbi:RNA ligase family protein [Xenophilus sp. Marseille-Q4582]|uniref:RNA ligase family protein n=1 Tax=Xenophilus sp. Marseille-Q4582 TaxID=2866600 RepID=UPI001CE3CBD8|nr:RNA ligase family protein [Xenophilus sp. Marseille-Q4582]